jgi:hypothetical protein
MTLFLLILVLIVSALLVIAQLIADRQSEAFLMHRVDAAKEIGDRLAADARQPRPPLALPPGRHRSDRFATGEFQQVPPGWTPPIGRRLIAAETSTQRILPPAKETHR